MIDFEPSEDQTLLAEMAKAFAARELRPHLRDHEANGLVAGLRATAAAAGLGELWSPEIDAIARCEVIEALAFGDGGAALALVGPALASAAAAEIGARAEVDTMHVHEGPPPATIAWLPVRGETTRVLQCSSSGGWRIVRARVEPIAALALHAAGSARCTVIGVQHLGTGATPAIATARLAIASILVGVARASLEYACAYVKERVTFGKRLADHQAVAFAIADVAMCVAAARALVLRAAATKDAAAAAHAFVEAAGAALFATERGVQLLGGHGYLKDHPVEKWMRDARALALLAGGRDLAAADSEHDAWEQAWT